MSVVSMSAGGYDLDFADGGDDGTQVQLQEYHDENYEPTREGTPRAPGGNAVARG